MSAEALELQSSSVLPSGWSKENKAASKLAQKTQGSKKHQKQSVCQPEDYAAVKLVVSDKLQEGSKHSSSTDLQRETSRAAAQVDHSSASVRVLDAVQENEVLEVVKRFNSPDEQLNALAATLAAQLERVIARRDEISEQSLNYDTWIKLRAEIESLYSNPKTAFVPYQSGDVREFFDKHYGKYHRLRVLFSDDLYRIDRKLTDGIRSYCSRSYVMNFSKFLPDKTVRDDIIIEKKWGTDKEIAHAIVRKAHRERMSQNRARLRQRYEALRVKTSFA